MHWIAFVLQFYGKEAFPNDSTIHQMNALSSPCLSFFTDQCSFKDAHFVDVWFVMSEEKIKDCSFFFQDSRRTKASIKKKNRYKKRKRKKKSTLSYLSTVKSKGKKKM